MTSSRQGPALVALTHLPSPHLEQGQRTHVCRLPIDYDLALRQHEVYREALRSCGCEVHVLDVNRHHPDGVFVEDTAVVLDEVAILASMGAESRRYEPAGIERVLREYREVRRIEPPATLEGGDVLRVGRTLLVGLTGRTNAAGIEALTALARPHGYHVRPVPIRQCLHLKSACTALPDGRLLANTACMDEDALSGFEVLPVPAEEPGAANVALVGETVLMDAACPRTAALIRSLGFEVRAVELSEFAKAEGSVTCLSLLFARG
jgi:dimethylargininase